MNCIISIITVEFKDAWDAAKIPDMDELFVTPLGDHPGLDGYVEYYNKEFLYEHLANKKYDQFAYDVDDCFEKYLSDYSLSYYLGCWIYVFLTYMHNEEIDSYELCHIDRSLRFADRLCCHDEVSRLISCYSSEQIFVVIKILNLFIDYNKYFDRHLCDEIILNLSRSVQILRTKIL